MGETIVIDAAGSTTPFPHFWEHMFGSCHASVTLCEDWRNDLRILKEIVDVKYVRFHGIFERSVGIYDREDKDDNLILNFTRVDLIYDGLLKNGVRPFVELGFMPEELAETQAVHPFWYHPIVAPPRDPQNWYQLIFLFAQHLVDRYGLAEVSDWYFEVWKRAEYQFLGGRAQRRNLLRPLRPNGTRSQSGQPPIESRRARYRASRLGGSFHPALWRKRCAS